MTLHSDVLNNCLRSPMLFFDTTPIGRILNRFSKDVDLIDTMIPRNWEMCIKCILNVVATLMVIIVNIPTFLAPAIPLALFYYLVQVCLVGSAPLHDGCCVRTHHALAIRSFKTIQGSHLPIQTTCQHMSPFIFSQYSYL